MKTYEFTLTFALPDPAADPGEFVERLAEAGCEDAVVGIGRHGKVALNFLREARSAEQALLSATRDVKKAIPGANLVEAAPDLVGVTAVAEILGCSRQNVQKVVIAHGTSFPAPVHEGSTSLWRLSKVLAWAIKRGTQIDPLLLETAQAAQQANLARELRDAKAGVQKKMQALFA